MTISQEDIKQMLKSFTDPEQDSDEEGDIPLDLEDEEGEEDCDEEGGGTDGENGVSGGCEESDEDEQPEATDPLIKPSKLGDSVVLPQSQPRR